MTKNLIISSEPKARFHILYWWYCVCTTETFGNVFNISNFPTYRNSGPLQETFRNVRM